MLSAIRFYFTGYTVAVIAVAIAFLLTQLIWLLIQPHLYPLFLAAVMVSSWYGGMGPGLLATAFAAVLCAYFFIPPIHSLAVNLDRSSGLLQFLLVALLISYLNTRLRSTQRQAEGNARERERNYEFLRQSQESLRQSEERYRLLVEGVTDYAIFMLDANSNFVSWNVGAERILGYQEAEIIGQPFERIFTPESIQQGLPVQVLQTAIAAGFSRENRWHIRKDGTHFWTHCVVAALRDESGNLRGFAKIMQDITQRKLAEEEREELLRREQAARLASEAAQSAAEAANRAKDDFLAVVSHELRTPMTAILGWAGMLRSGMLDACRAALAVETIERNANLQMQLIEDLLDISRIVRGDISLNFGRVALATVITAAMEILQPAADAKSMQLQFKLDTSVEAIWGDSERLQQVVLNLLANAIKFTPAGGKVTVKLFIVHCSSLVAHSNQQSTINRFAQIQVSDTGIGIAAEFLPYVFERFRQADSTSARANKGLGLGLAIARHLVELHGGSIQVESPGISQGTTFTLNLPYKTTSLLEETTANHPNQIQFLPTSGEDAPRLNSLRVLVVDDELDVREWICTVLEQSGAEVIAAASVGEALAALAQQRPDVLLSDIGMPREDGYALMRLIRELEPEMGRTIPAVALTGYAREEDYTEAIAAGFQMHVAKPIRAAELVAVVASLAKMAGEL